MATISFYADQTVQVPPGSGYGFFGDNGFGDSLLVGAWNGRTFVTDSNGTLQGNEADNVKWTHPASAILGQVGSGIPNLKIPNNQASLRISFTHDSAVQVQNWQVKIYDRVNTTRGASGVTTALYAVNHVSPLQTVFGSGATNWTIIVAGNASGVTLPNSPGNNGAYAGNGSNSVRPDTQHDAYLNISVSPDSIGSKTQFGLYTSLEYL